MLKNFRIDDEGYISIGNNLSAHKEVVYSQIKQGGTTDFWIEKIKEWRQKGILN